MPQGRRRPSNQVCNLFSLRAFNMSGCDKFKACSANARSFFLYDVFLKDSLAIFCFLLIAEVPFPHCGGFFDFNFRNSSRQFTSLCWYGRIVTWILIEVVREARSDAMTCALSKFRFTWLGRSFLIQGGILQSVTSGFWETSMTHFN